MAASARYASLIPAFAAHRVVHAVDALGEAGRSVPAAAGALGRLRTLPAAAEAHTLPDAHDVTLRAADRAFVVSRVLDLVNRVDGAPFGPG